MAAALNLRLDVLDATSVVDTLRGPGSALSEKIPNASPDNPSPFTPSVDSHQRPEPARNLAAVGTLRDESADSDSDEEEQEEHGLHVVVVGGNVGAFATSLALAKSEGICVTLVNVGVGPFGALESGNTAQGSVLSAQTVSYLDELGNWEGSNPRGAQNDVPPGLESRSNRWKGKGSPWESASIGERIREEGARLNSFSMHRYSDGGQLASQDYTISTGEDVTMNAIDNNALVTILRDACLSHPRIGVRPRAIVRAVLPGAPAPPESIGTSKNNIRRKARESFIQLDDDEHENTSPASILSQIDLMQNSHTNASLNELLRNLPAPLQGRNPFSTEDLQGDAEPVTGSKLGTMLYDEWRSCKPTVILTSGERLEADAVLGTEGPQSKVLDVIHPTHEDARGGQVMREDGVFRAIIPISRLMDDPELSTLVGDRQGSAAILVTWPGPGRSLSTYPINTSNLYVQQAVRGRRVCENIEDDEVAVALQMKREVVGWCPTVTKLIALVDSATYEPVLDCNQLSRWASNSGRVGVLSDAAHPILPFAHHALAASISDALTLGVLFRKNLMHPSYLGGHRSPHLIPHVLSAFERIRRPRCLRTQLTLREGRDLLWLEDGESQRMRDRTLRESGQLLTEEEKHAEWLDDPFGVVERWWESENCGFGRT